MNKYIKNIITDFLSEEDNYFIFNEIIDDDYEKKTLLTEYSKRLVEYCRRMNKEEDY
jgi:hypothetical protein